jgi:hypothetical protein
MPIDTSLPWGGNDRNESDLRARVAAIGLEDVKPDAPMSADCGLPASVVIRSILKSLSSLNRGRPRFLCCTS